MSTLLKSACPSAALFQASAKFDQTNRAGQPIGLLSRSTGDLTATDTKTTSGITTRELKKSTMSKARLRETRKTGFKRLANVLGWADICILEFHLSFAQETQIDHGQAENEQGEDNAYRSCVAKVVQGKCLCVDAQGQRLAGISGSAVRHHKNQIKRFHTANQGEHDINGDGRGNQRKGDMPKSLPARGAIDVCHFV